VSRDPRHLALAALLAAGCASALKEPPPLSALHREGTGTTDAATLLADAAQAYARRPDLAAVRRAEAACLEAAQVDDAGIDGLLCAIRAKSWLAEREKDVQVRGDLSVSAVQLGQWCLRRAPASPACKYWLAVALGLQARDRPSTVEDSLKRMVQLLREVGKEAPLYDEAGPERVLAILLLRAPGWPVGPGDPEAALPLARRAVELLPDYPPNQLALGEALLANDERVKALEALDRAVSLAGKAPASDNPDAPGWIAQAAALRKR
jgi:tetratricopeptide (TPR) repeat protein